MSFLQIMHIVSKTALVLNIRLEFVLDTSMEDHMAREHPISGSAGYKKRSDGRSRKKRVDPSFEREHI